MTYALEWDLRFLRLAAQVASWSKDPSTQTGAVIVRPDRTIAAVGYNGFPRGMPDKPELYALREEKYSRIVHCEINAFTQSRDRDVHGYTLYTWPFLSCDRCFVQLAGAGIARFVAPVASAEQLTRWGEEFARVRRYADEMHVRVQLYPREHFKDLLDG